MVPRAFSDILFFYRSLRACFRCVVYVHAGPLFIGVCWVISLLTRNPRKAIAPAVITIILLLCTLRININFTNGMKRMVPEGDAIVRALEDYHRQYGDYPKELDQLV